MTILGIETSCDETASSLIEEKNGRCSVLTSVVASQIKIHAKTGGIVPEVAARNHILAIIPVIQRALKGKMPDAIAVTAGPGLVTSLGVGVQTARTFSYIWKKPLIAVNHIEGHLYANFICASTKSQITNHKSIAFPAVVLIVSGGHTELILMTGHGKYQLLGKTLDDAAGEAFDKGAKILGLGYPGGPAISKAAEKGDTVRYDFPRPLLSSRNYDFSFSGLKTSLLYRVRDMKKEGTRFTPKVIADLAASYQAAIVDVLVAKTVRAAKEYSVKTVLSGGGVMANKELRKRLENSLKKNGIDFRVPPYSLCTDNASMIACAGAFKAHRREYVLWRDVDARSTWGVTSNE